MCLINIAIIGECMIELKRVNGRLEQGFGGDTLNTAIYLSRLTYGSHVKTTYVTGLGIDPFSTDMLQAWQQEHLNTDMVYQLNDKLPGMYAIETSENGERSFYYWRNDSAAKHWLKEQNESELLSKLSQHQIIYLSGISLAVLPIEDRAKLLNLLCQCKKLGSVIYFDNNFRPALWQSTTEARYWYSEILKLTDTAFLTYDDEVMLWQDQNESDTVTRSQSFGVREIVIKRGKDECYVISDNSQLSVSPRHVETVVDTTAAGDSFSAGYIAKRVLGASSEQAAQYAHTLAGEVIQHHGAVIPLSSMPNC
ncbi:sugar kinase [Vibrio sp. 99-8-1]|uniref:sugar kinase n=1 Tax=Vibrio sp. 99-8-1 TaxID=2607602 RepID=UPI001493360B|nr:sugar kinase [Vibrio sp. 99-8-1]NOI67383.1 sugar kinase [Vibrio sp. 99-8-1]